MNEPDYDFHKARNLTEWLRLRYCISYSEYSRKHWMMKTILRREYREDTGNRLPPMPGE